MALFESYERRIDKINSVLNSYGIASIEEAEKITKDAGLDVYAQVKKSSQFVLKMPVGHIQSAQRSQSKKVVSVRRTQQQPLAKASGFLYPWFCS
mgnify:CR=1 FL=1